MSMLELWEYVLISVREVSKSVVEIPFILTRFAILGCYV